jgi:hypothetical protein
LIPVKTLTAEENYQMLTRAFVETAQSRLPSCTTLRLVNYTDRSH